MDIVFVNGEFLPKDEAKISVFDSGYYFGDGIYEVFLMYKRAIIHVDCHLNRMQKCAEKVHFKNVPSSADLRIIIEQLVAKNPHIQIGSIYLQMTRGMAQRGHDFEKLNLMPSIVAWIKPINIDLTKFSHPGWHCELMEDPRRMRRDIKMISLMPMVIAKLETSYKGFDDIIFFDQKSKAITELSSGNLFIVDKDDNILTHPLGTELLDGCFRKELIKYLDKLGRKVIEKQFFADDLFKAKEVFGTGSIKIVVPIIKVDGVQIGDGKPGKVTQLAQDMFQNFIESHVK